MWQHRGRGAADVADYLINKSAELDRGDVTDTVDSSDAATES